MNINEQIAVMQHFAAGGKIEYQIKDTWASFVWHSNLTPVWDWNNYSYRIVQPKIAEGYNPNKLTEEQVGVSEGWRLLSLEEFNALIPNGNDLSELSHSGYDVIWKCGGCGGCNGINYRTRQYPGYFLPKKKVKVPLEMSDLPVACWVRLKRTPHIHHNVLTIRPEGIKILGGIQSILDYSFQELMDDNFEYYSFGENWKPCHKEIEQ